jgi:phosphoglycolate phosphatase-like HAD superfamily hydrolase
MGLVNMDKVILFDLDGTIVDNTNHIMSCLKIAIQKLNIEFDNNITNNISGKSFSQISSMLNLSKNEAKKLIDFYFQCDSSNINNLSLIDGMLKLLLKYHNLNFRLGIVTSKINKTTSILMDHFNLLPYFETIITSSDVNNVKPNPEPLLLACKKLNVLPSKNICYIGDSLSDIFASINADLTPIGVTWGNSGSKLHDQNDVKVVDNIKNLEKYLDRHYGII